MLEALFGGGSEEHRIIVQEIRLPRAILALAIGAILGLSGAALQGLLRNPLASPSLFGAPQSAAFGAVLMIALGLADVRSFVLPVAAIADAFASVFVLLGGRRAQCRAAAADPRRPRDLEPCGRCDVAGDEPVTQSVCCAGDRFWLLGSLEDRSFRHVMLALPFIVAGAVDPVEPAQRLPRAQPWRGDRAEPWRQCRPVALSVIAGVALGVGGAVAVAGAIGFIGLVAPHLMRPLIGHDPARLLLPSALTGAALLLAADIARARSFRRPPISRSAC